MDEKRRKYLIAGIVIVVIVAVFLFLRLGTGELSRRYRTWYNFPTIMNEEYEATTAEARSLLVESNISDPEVFSKEMSLIVSPIEAKKEFAIDILYQAGDGTVHTVAIDERRLTAMNEKYRELFKAQLTSFFFKTLEARGIKDDGKIVAAVVRWKSGWKDGVYSVCDWDGDGVWDCGSRDLVGRGLRIETFSDSANDWCRTIGDKKYYLVCGTSEQIVSLSDLDGGEDFYCLQRLID